MIFWARFLGLWSASRDGDGVRRASRWDRILGCVDSSGILSQPEEFRVEFERGNEMGSVSDFQRLVRGVRLRRFSKAGFQGIRGLSFDER
jgi:hypothetical protein